MVGLKRVYDKMTSDETPPNDGLLTAAIENVLEILLRKDLEYPESDFTDIIVSTCTLYAFYRYLSHKNGSDPLCLDAIVLFKQKLNLK